MKKLILASVSPRRRVLMKCMGLEFEVIPSKFEEYLDDKRSTEEIVTELGFGKANNVAEEHPDSYVVGGDVIVVIDGKQLGKPENEAEAKSMLQMLSGRSHQIVGSVVLVCKNEKIHDVSVSTLNVIFSEIPEKVMDAYIVTGDPYDKAGGYAWLHPLIKPYISFNGDAHIITGLSTIELRKLLENRGYKVPNNEAKTKELFAKADLEDLKVVV